MQLGSKLTYIEGFDHFIIDNAIENNNEFMTDLILLGIVRNYNVKLELKLVFSTRNGAVV